MCCNSCVALYFFSYVYINILNKPTIMLFFTLISSYFLMSVRCIYDLRLARTEFVVRLIAQHVWSDSDRFGTNCLLFQKTTKQRKTYVRMYLVCTYTTYVRCIANVMHVGKMKNDLRRWRLVVRSAYVRESGSGGTRNTKGKLIYISIVMNLRIADE